MGYAPNMACPRCGSETRTGQKFCAECGLALSAACPNCGAAYEGSPKFCAECGFGLGAAADTASPGGDRQSAATARPAPPAAERRFVSVLFADLVGFTTMSEEEDPEEVRDLLSRYFEAAREVIENYGGTVEKFIGDAVMAVWGAPIAQEDDAERAVRAALGLVERVRQLALRGDPLNVRAGVMTGEAAVTPGRAQEGMVAGDLVNTASRLQSVAPAGTVLVGEATYRATTAAIAYEPAGEQLLKGKAAPVDAWRALRVVARVGGEARNAGLEAPFVGRDEELRLLRDQLHAAEREGKLRVVSVTGQAGIGKSRLAWELEKYLDGLAGPIYYWHQGRSPSYGAGVTYWALGEMIRRRARIAETDDAATTREKLRSALAEFVPDQEERRWLEPALGALLGIDEPDWEQREQLYSAWRTFIERIADKGPTVLVFEDLQWADSGLLDFIDHLLDWTRDRPILVVTLARPEFLEKRPDFGRAHRAFSALHLEPLTPAAMAEVLRGLVPALPAEDVERIVVRAEGLPLYAIETVRSLADTGHLVRVADTFEPTGPLPVLDIPPTLRALIASRLDAIDPQDRALLQDGAVIGQVFAVPAVAALAGRPEGEVSERLRVLAMKELVALENDPRSPERGQYRFTQGVVREVAYATLSRRERRARHIAAARHFEALGDDEMAGVLANHYLEAYEAAPEGEEGAAVAAQARLALRGAADRAAGLHSHEQAAVYLEQAIAVTFEEDDRMELRLRAAQSALSVGQLERSEEHYRAVLDWYQSRGDQRAIRVAALLARMLLYASKVDESMAVVQAALPNAEPDSREFIDLNAEVARAHMFRDEPDLALLATERGLAAAEAKVLPGPTIMLLITKSWALTSARRPREATALLVGALEMARTEGFVAAELRAMFNLAGYIVTDDPRAAVVLGTEGLAKARQLGLALNAANLAANIASAELLIGDLRHILQLENEADELRTPISAGLHGYAAAAAGLMGDAAGARQRLELLEKANADASSAQDRSALGAMRAMVAFGSGEVQAARDFARQGRDAYFGSDGPIAAVLAARLSVLLGDLEAAQIDVERLKEYEIFGAWLARCAREVEAGVLALRGEVEPSLAAYRRVIEDWSQADMPLDGALALFTRAHLLGGHDAQAAEGRAEAARLLGSIGADGLLERLEAGLPPPPTFPARSTEAQPRDAAAAPR